MGVHRATMKEALKKCYSLVAFASPDMAEEIKEVIFSCYENLTGKSAGQIIIKKKKFRSHSPKIIVDVSFISFSNLGTGIQRVVNNVYTNIARIREKDVIPGRVLHEIYITSRKYHDDVFHISYDGREYRLPFYEGDKFLLLDSIWDYYKDFNAILPQAKESGTQISAVVYDLIPILYPELFSSEQFVNNFRQWQNLSLSQCDNVLCISRTVADAVANYYKSARIKRDKPLSLYYFHMGSHFEEVKGQVRKEIADFVSQGNVFLMVGTLEIRKGHVTVLEALEKIRKQGKSAKLLIIGHDGWKNNEFMKKLQNFSFGDILWIQDATDAELHWAYRHVSALIVASRDEGFGLPLIEAAYFGVPIICSDIPIFREVTEGHATFFKVMDSDSLAEILIKWMHTEVHPDSKKIRLYSWKESAQEILDIMDGKVKPYKVLQ